MRQHCECKGCYDHSYHHSRHLYEANAAVQGYAQAEGMENVLLPEGEGTPANANAEGAQ